MECSSCTVVLTRRTHWERGRTPMNPYPPLSRLKSCLSCLAILGHYLYSHYPNRRRLKWYTCSNPTVRPRPSHEIASSLATVRRQCKVMCRSLSTDQHLGPQPTASDLFTTRTQCKGMLGLPPPLQILRTSDLLNRIGQRSSRR